MLKRIIKQHDRIFCKETIISLKIKEMFQLMAGVYYEDHDIQGDLANRSHCPLPFEEFHSIEEMKMAFTSDIILNVAFYMQCLAAAILSFLFFAVVMPITLQFDKDDGLLTKLAGAFLFPIFSTLALAAVVAATPLGIAYTFINPITRGLKSAANYAMGLFAKPQDRDEYKIDEYNQESSSNNY